MNAVAKTSINFGRKRACIRGGLSKDDKPVKENFVSKDDDEIQYGEHECIEKVMNGLNLDQMLPGVM